MHRSLGVPRCPGGDRYPQAAGARLRPDTRCEPARCERIELQLLAPIKVRETQPAPAPALAISIHGGPCEAARGAPSSLVRSEPVRAPAKFCVKVGFPLHGCRIGNIIGGRFQNLFPKLGVVVLAEEGVQAGGDYNCGLDGVRIGSFYAEFA